MNKFNNLFYCLIEKRDDETDEEAYKRQSAGLEKLRQMSQIKKDMNAAGNTQDARLQALKNLTDLRYGKGSYASQQQAPGQPPSTQPSQAQPSQAASKTAPTPASTNPAPQPSQAASKTAPTPASTNPVDVAKIAKQYDTMNKIANDPNAPQGEKSAAKKKMSEFESKYQEIISKYKTVPSAPAKPAPAKPAPAKPAPAKPAPVNPAPAKPAPVNPAPVNPPPATATAPVVPKPAAAPVVATPPTPQLAPPTAPVAPAGGGRIPPPPTAPVAPAGGGRIPPPPTPPRPSSPPAGPSSNKPRGIPNPKQPQQQQRAPRPYNLGGLQQRWQQMGLGPSAKANALPRGKAAKQQGMLSKIAQAPFKALQKGVGAYSAITNAPRALGQSLKAAAGGDPYRLQQQIGSIPRVAGLPAVQVKTQQDRLQYLTNQLSQQPTNQQLVQQIQQLQKQINTMQQNAQRIK